MHIFSFKTFTLSVAFALGILAQTGASVAAKLQTAVVAGGCFWCVEADFESVPGVIKAVSGYTGGTTPNPTYKEIGKGGTGHFEAVKITYDPDILSYEQLVFMFLRSIDPTDAGGQFCDRGDSYRTAIFVDGANERQIATSAIAKAQADLGRSIVTPILKASRFYRAEAYHQNYYKGSKIVITRRGPKKQSAAYAFYRKGCGRDARVDALWGNAAPFTH